MSTLPGSDSGDCRSRLIQAATAVFIEEGYRASIERIATRAGVARQTLYNHFPAKADLFGEVIRQATHALLITLDGDGDGLRERLLRFGLALRNKALSEEGLGFYRSLLAETARFPELAANFYRTGPAQTAARLREILAQAMARGELRAEDPEFAATMLISMLIDGERSHCLLTGKTPPGSDPAHVARIIDCYFRAFRPETFTSHAVPQRSFP